ncbi:MAG: Eco57I restriction-modification methylase domain-containing protein [Acidimicrobiales bacterium]
MAFPEVFADSPQPGFDAIIGNPPFSGGQKISGRLGGEYGKWLQRWNGRDVKGSADLVARFVLRANRLLSARAAGVRVVQHPFRRRHLAGRPPPGNQRRSHHLAGKSAHPWPSASANVSIVNFWAARLKPGRDARCWLDGEEVARITPDLQPYGRVEGRPFPLRENADVAFQGSNIRGLGFTLTPTRPRP